MDEQMLALLTDLHIDNQRQGPGSNAATLRALELSRVATDAPLQIADIGCGTGAATIPLLTHTQAEVTAVDLLGTFLKKLEENAKLAGVSDRITTVETDMNELPFSDEQFDVIWSEGAVYNVGFENGVRDWRRFLKPNGVLVASEITWLQPHVPEPLRAHWAEEYPEVATAAEKIKVLEEVGYSLLGYFPLTSDCWIDNYYRPLQNKFVTFLERQNNSETAQEIVAAEEKEIALYEQYQDHVSYGVYIARKVER